MKKVIATLFAISMTVISSVNTFAYIKVYSPYVTTKILTNEYIYRNGTAMVKFRDIISTMNGKIEYNASNKSIKTYLNTVYDVELATKSISVKAGKNIIEYTDAWGKRKSAYTRVTPVIINGSLYVSAMDLGTALCPWAYYGTALADIKNGVLNIYYDVNAS